MSSSRLLASELTAQSHSVLNTPSWIQKLQVARYWKRRRWMFLARQLTSAFPRISTPNASLNELILTSGVFPGHHTFKLGPSDAWWLTHLLAQ
jgi:hypothetical protein